MECRYARVHELAGGVGRILHQGANFSQYWRAEQKLVTLALNFIQPVKQGRATRRLKFGQKLDFIERMTRWSETCREPTVLVGDLNIAPLECDVWSHKQLLNVVSHTPVEVEALTGLQQSNDWVDLGRQFVPAPERMYTWWSYRSPDWTKNDRGRRLDHMWATKDVAAQAVSHKVYKPCRAWARPSDHVPLMTEFAF